MQLEAAEIDNDPTELLLGMTPNGVASNKEAARMGGFFVVRWLMVLVEDRSHRIVRR
jgi:hypothetical protein